MLLQPSDFRTALICGAQNIAKHQAQIDALNVFPVPDGDTGKNLALTLLGARRALEELACDATIPELGSAFAEALLRNARGNSGVIFSLLFQGFKTLESLNAKALSEALNRGIEAAYASISAPTEGTILTVARAAAEAAGTAAAEECDAKELLVKALSQAKEALKKTPELLPILKKAGVVDAGGEGYVIFLSGVISYLQNGEIIHADADFEQQTRDPIPLLEEEITFTYCTEFTVCTESETENVHELRQILNKLGDSVVVVQIEGMIKAHVHTDRPDEALKAGLCFGMLETTKIENMRLQFRKRKAQAQETPPSFAEPTEEFGLVAVASGEGLVQLFTELGAAGVVHGGQSMNPSTEDLVRACRATPAKTVFLLPNNKNVLLCAKGAAKLVNDREVIVLNSVTIPQGVAAAIAFDPEPEERDRLLESMEHAIQHVKTGQITHAVRDAQIDGLEITQGQVLALKEDRLAFCAHDPIDALLRLTRELSGAQAQFITLFYGMDAGEEEAQEAKRRLCLWFPNAEINLVGGMQPIYRYLISVEV